MSFLKRSIVPCLFLFTAMTNMVNAAVDTTAQPVEVLDQNDLGVKPETLDTLFNALIIQTLQMIIGANCEYKINSDGTQTYNYSKECIQKVNEYRTMVANTESLSDSLADIDRYLKVNGIPILMSNKNSNINPNNQI